MYSEGGKGKRSSKAIELREEQTAYTPAAEGPMVRTQVYLTKEEHAFVQREGARAGKPMAAMIRQWIDEKMEIPEEAWLNNPLLDPPADPNFESPEDGAINHDHYIY